MARNLSAQGWRDVELLHSVDSTNTRALAAATAWQLVSADEQVAGRGRLDRTWQVPASTAVTVSMTLPLPRSATAWGWVPLFVGDAVRQALATLAPGQGPDAFVATKWPNDVLLRDPDGEWRKVCGVLCQVVPGRTDLVVAGVGINVEQTREQLPVETATSTRLAGLGCSRADVLVAVAREVRESASTWSTKAPGEAAYDALIERVRVHSRTLGSEIEVHTSGGVRTCTGVAIDDAGRLVTRAPGSRPGESSTMVHSVADVVHARIAASGRRES